MALISNATPIAAADTISDTIKVTSGYFTDGDGTLAGSAVNTGSLSDSNELYYFNVNHKIETDKTSETQFSVTYGHFGGSGSDTHGDTTSTSTTLKGQTQAIYQQFANILQPHR